MKVRIAAVQYQFRRITSFEDFKQQIEFVLTSAAEYHPHYVLLPELFTTQMLSFIQTSDIANAVKKLAAYTDKYIDLLKGFAEKYKFYLIGGTHPTLRGEKLFNTAYLFTPEGKVFTQDKVHRTRWEKELWGISPGEEFKIFKTKFAPISILVCYDIEFPEAARIVPEAGAEIIFVPSTTDDRQGFLRVRYCCHARAIENQVYVVMTGTVGNLPVENLNLHYGQACIITPSDFPFSRDGIAAEGMINQEQIIIADVDLDSLDQNRIKGTTIPLLDKRKDLYQKAAVIEDTN
ncbi:MAG: carbon-nitrogen hydrolase family protein [Ignavibacteriaceae bacterium]